MQNQIPQIATPKFAEYKFFTLLFYTLVIGFSTKFAGGMLGLDRGAFGGPSAWVGGILILYLLWSVSAKYVRETQSVIRMLENSELPCVSCGYPLMDDETLPCPECGRFFSRSEVIEYWKNRVMIEPFPFDEVSDQ